MATVRLLDTLIEMGFSPVSPGISIYKPSTLHKRRANSQSIPHPDLIIVCAWGFAKPRHIRKYITRHQSIFPQASILLLQNTFDNVMWKPDSWQMSWFRPAAAAIHALVKPLPALKVFLHVFSNTGAHAAVQLAQGYREMFQGKHFPITAIVFDSCPAFPRLETVATALSHGIPFTNALLRAFVVACSYVFVASLLLLDAIGISESAARKLYRTLNDHEGGFLWHQIGEKQHPIPRTYIFGPQDPLIPEDDVYNHGREAMRRLSEHAVEDAQSYVVFERFLGSPHVNHIKIEEERYWDVVKKTWQNGVNAKT